MKEDQYSTIDEVIEISRSYIGSTFGNLDKKDRLTLTKDKGRLGVIIEEGVVGYEPNGDQAPDIKNLGLEIKSTGYRVVNGGKSISAKERLVITMIDFMRDYKVGFYDSHLYEKIKRILLYLYEYRPDLKFDDFMLSDILLYQFDSIPDEDREIIIQDYQSIINKIKAGKAHELSESDTNYLGACTKGANSKSVTKQPFCDIPAMKRAFALKNSYITQLLRKELAEGNIECIYSSNPISNRTVKSSNKPSDNDSSSSYTIDSQVLSKQNNNNHATQNQESEIVESPMSVETVGQSIVKDLNTLKKMTFDHLVISLFQPYVKLSLTEIDALLGQRISRMDKSYLANYVARMMNVSMSNLDDIVEFKKANIKVKTIRVSHTGRIKESMSFPAFDYIQLSKETWEDSQLRSYFDETRFLFVVFEEIDDSRHEYRFVGSKLWNMPYSDREKSLCSVWNKMHDILNGNIFLKAINSNTIGNNFPASTESRVAHVRPHAKNAYDTNKLPATCKIIVENGVISDRVNSFIKNHEYTKHSFWLNNSYVLDIISDLLAK